MLAQLLKDVRIVELKHDALERALAAIADTDPIVRLLMTIPGIRLITASALVARRLRRLPVSSLFWSIAP